MKSRVLLFFCISHGLSCQTCNASRLWTFSSCGLGIQDFNWSWQRPAVHQQTSYEPQCTCGTDTAEHPALRSWRATWGWNLLILPSYPFRWGQSQSAARQCVWVSLCRCATWWVRLSTHSPDPVGAFFHFPICLAFSPPCSFTLHYLHLYALIFSGCYSVVRLCIARHLCQLAHREHMWLRVCKCRAAANQSSWCELDCRSNRIT